MLPAPIGGLWPRHMAKSPLVAGGREGRKMSLLDQKIEDYISDQEEILFEYEDYYSYSYPYEDDVPESWYYSIITDVRKPPDCGYKSYVDVYYKIAKTEVLNAYLDGYIEADKVKYYFIRQRYVINSVHYREFSTAMHEALGKRKFGAKDLIGVTEGFHLVYEKEGSIGSIRSRQPVDIAAKYLYLDEGDTDDEIDEE